MMVRRAGFCLLLATVGGCGLVGPGVAPATPQRPTYSSDTNTTAIGTVEVEAGLLVDPHDAIDTPLVVKYGAGLSTEVFVGWSPYVKAYRPGTEARGAGDVVVGSRHRFVDGEGGDPSAAVQLTGKIPTASESAGIGNGEYDFTAAAILSGANGDWAWTTYYELGMLGEESGSGYDTRHGLAGVLGIPITEEVAGFAELAGLWTRARSENPVFTTWGLAYSEEPGVVWDIALVFGLNDDAADTRLVVGVTRNFGRIARGEAPPL